MEASGGGVGCIVEGADGGMGGRNAAGGGGGDGGRCTDYLHAARRWWRQVYDISDSQSFEHVESWIAEINKFTADSDVRVLVVGNKVRGEEVGGRWSSGEGRGGCLVRGEEVGSVSPGLGDGAIGGLHPRP